MTSAPAPSGTSGLDGRLGSHLRAWLGRWPPQAPLDVVGSPARLAPAWDGAYVPAVAVAAPEGTVVSVPPATESAVHAALPASRDVAAFRRALGEAVGAPGRASPWVTLRWSTAPAPLPDVGVWLDSTHPALPAWLNAFPGKVLAVLDDHGKYLAGAGIKVHTPLGQEIAVGTDPSARGQGLARKVVAQAARTILDTGAVPLYVHESDNVPSARVADAAGFPDLGWRLMVVWGSES